MTHPAHTIIRFICLCLAPLNLYLLSSLSCDQEGIIIQHESQEAAVVPPPRYVVCTRVRNEAPYLREWIEYHRMIGFDTFLILNDESTDDTQCILDAYAKENIVLRIPFDVGDSYSGKLWHIFDDCANYLNSHPEQFNPSKTWMMTHDTDEFVYIKKGNSIHDAVTRLSHPNQVMSMEVPRLTFGSSGRENYQPHLVIDRFTQRYNHTICPEWWKKMRKVSKEIKGGRGSPCYRQSYPTDSFDHVKSISLVSQMAEECYTLNKDTGNVLPEKMCQDTHLHTLVDVGEYRAFNEKSPPGRGNKGKEERENDPRYADQFTVGKDVVIMHYLVKSRQEFYDRVCNSVWSDKYFECSECTPETFFDLTNTYANGFKDTRMAGMSPRLKQRLASSSVGASCKTQVKLKSMDYYGKCFKQIRAELQDGTREYMHDPPSKKIGKGTKSIA